MICKTGRTAVYKGGISRETQEQLDQEMVSGKGGKRDSLKARPNTESIQNLTTCRNPDRHTCSVCLRGIFQK